MSQTAEHPLDPTPAVHAIYCHGFASSPQSTLKGQLLSQRLSGHCKSFQLPDFEQGDFFHLRMDRMAAILEQQIADLPDDQAPLLLIGSSLGAYLAAGQAARGLGRPGALLLIAPAFAFVSRWTQLLGEEGLMSWRQQGQRFFYHHRSGSEQALGVGFLDSCQGLADYPAASHLPTVVVHGRQDEVADWQDALAYANTCPQASFHLLNEGHSLESEEATSFILSQARNLLLQLASEPHSVQRSEQGDVSPAARPCS